MATWQEQYDRAARWYERFRAIDVGRSHDMPSDNYLDEIHAFFQNCYHVKDWIIHDPALPSSVRDGVESFINASRPLRLCADICNATKHLKLTKTGRSGEEPAFGNKHVHLHLGGGVPTTIRIQYEITTTAGPEDAFDLASSCMKEWDTFRTKWHL